MCLNFIGNLDGGFVFLVVIVLKVEFTENRIGLANVYLLEHKYKLIFNFQMVHISYY